MAARHVLRLAGWALACVLGIVALGAALGPAWFLIGFGGATLATVMLVVWLPRSAHSAFGHGRHARAARRYRVIQALAFSVRRERAAILSRAGCFITLKRLEPAERLLDKLVPAELDVAERAVWLNNRACALLEAGTDPHGALAMVEEATALRPDVPAVQHTRGLALLAVGRIDDAIAVFDGMRSGGELAPSLEAERCRDLASAWDRKGQTEYAEDYRQRALQVAR